MSFTPPTGKKAAEKLLSDVEEDDEDDMPDLEGEEEGEKENEDLCNDVGSPGPNPNRKRKRAHENSAATNEPNDKKNKADKSGEQGAAPFFFTCVFLSTTYLMHARMCYIVDHCIVFPSIRRSLQTRRRRSCRFRIVS